MNHVITNFFFLILIGFIITHLPYRFRYNFYQDNGNSLILKSLIYGVFFHLGVTLFAFLVKVCILFFSTLLAGEKGSENTFDTFPNANTINIVKELENELSCLFAIKKKSNKTNTETITEEEFCFQDDSNNKNSTVFTLWVAIFVVILFGLLEKIFPILDHTEQINNSVRNGGQLEKILAGAFRTDNKRIYQFVLSDRNVYFGYVVGLGLNPKSENYDYKIEPVVRGYLNENYQFDKSEMFEEDNLGVILKVEDTVSITPYDDFPEFTKKNKESSSSLANQVETFSNNVKSDIDVIKKIQKVSKDVINHSDSTTDKG